jgi:hypothetical protein
LATTEKVRKDRCNVETRVSPSENPLSFTAPFSRVLGVMANDETSNLWQVSPATMCPRHFPPINWSRLSRMRSRQRLDQPSNLHAEACLGKASPIISLTLSQASFLVRASDARFTPADHPQISATCTQIEPPNRYSVTRLVVSALLFIRLQASANHATSTMMNFVLP